MSRAVQVRVTGRVQGVFFRRYAEGEARRLGVAGWVSNEPGGSVLAHVEGADEAVEAMIAWCRAGSPGAHVERVDIEDVEALGASSFTVRA